jgi:hypothetical protein
MRLYCNEDVFLCVPIRYHMAVSATLTATTVEDDR